ncbi:unnamed protein product [Symbiodinium microadriaticum]|nr:unnamed protein product [Symbiodinium microadriaticum]
MPDALSHLVVAGAGCDDVNGVYELQEGFLCEGCPVYGNLSDFSLTVCQGPAADTGKLQWGWILGRSGVPAYGCPTDTKEELPLHGWQPFEGDAPAPTLRWVTSADATAEGYAQEARRRAASGTIENQRLAVKAFRQSLQTVEKERADRTQRALLHTELAALLRTLSREDQALTEVEAALRLRHSLPEALLLKAHLLNAASNEGAAALAVKQCWIQIESANGKADSNTRRLQRECKELLQELAEPCDGLLPKAWPVSVCAAEAPKMLHEGVMDFCIEAVELQGSSMAESDGVYEPSRKVSNGFPVFENRFGFQLSMEVQATKAGDVSAGWIVGRKNVGFFGTRQLEANQLPSNDWHCFPAASKESAPTVCSVKTTQLEEDLGWGHWARLGNYGGPAEAARILPTCVNRLGRGGDLRRAAWALTELAGAHRQLGKLADASMTARQALATCPSLPQAYLELACCLHHLGQKDEAADILQELLAQQPNDGRAKEALLLLGLDLSCPRDIPCEVPTDEITQQAKASKNPDVLDFTLEDQRTEVHAHWVLASLRKAKDILVRFQEQRLLVAVGEDTLFDGELAHRIKPSDSSWTFATPDLTVTLCKCSEDGRWPRWEVLHKEDPEERLQRRDTSDVLCKRSLGSPSIAIASNTAMLESDDPFNIRRFADQQRKHYSTALQEVRDGQKRSHWMWYVFPTPPYVQNGAECGSPTNKFYAIRSDEEAAAYLSFEEDGICLRKNYMEMVQAVLQQLRLGTSVLDLMGEADEPKFRKSLQFFSRVAKQSKDRELQEVCDDALLLMGNKGFLCGSCSVCVVQ